MTVFNLGSINADLTYRVPHLPGPGETLSAQSLTRGLGGKGANMSVAAARAAARVAHIGAVGTDGAWMVERLMEYGVDTRLIKTVDVPTGHAIIALDGLGENNILIYPGANHAITQEAISEALAQSVPGDIFVCQNETNLQAEGVALAVKRGLRVAYAAAPFDADAVKQIMGQLDLLVLNAVEAQQLQEATGKPPEALPIADVVITLGADGCRWFDTRAGSSRDFPAFKVKPVDTTGAGDTFTGYLLAGMDRGMPMAQAIAQAQRAAAIMVTRLGTADVIPDLRDVQEARLS